MSAETSTGSCCIFHLKQKMQRRRKTDLVTRILAYWWHVTCCMLPTCASTTVKASYVPQSSTAYMGSLNRCVRIHWAPRLCMRLNYSLCSRTQALPNQFNLKLTGILVHQYIQTGLGLIVFQRKHVWSRANELCWWSFSDGLQNILPRKTVGSCLLYSYTSVEFYFFSGASPQL